MLAESLASEVQNFGATHPGNNPALPHALALSNCRRASVHEALHKEFPCCRQPYRSLPNGILDPLHEIAGKVTAGHYRDDIDLLKQIIFDANTLVLNPPCASHDSTKTVLFSIRTYKNILENILAQNTVEQSDLEYLHTHRYRELNAPQRFFLLSLYVLPQTVRADFLKSNHGSQLLEHPELAYWLIHSPHIHFRQTRLNTCIATVFSQECLTHAPTLAALLPICKVLLKHIQLLVEEAPASLLEKLTWNGGPSIKIAYQERIQEITALLQTWERKLGQALSTPTNKLDLNALAADGHACLETLLSCASIAAPHWGTDDEALFTINTPYIIPGQWHLSCILTCIHQGWQRLLKKNIPSLKERYYKGYVSYDGCKTLLDKAIKLPGAHEDTIVFPANVRPSDEALAQLWEDVTHMGSARLERPGHAALLRTHVRNKTRHFILHDPLKKHAQTLDFKALATLFGPQKIIVFIETKKN